MRMIWFCDLVSGDIWVFYLVCSRVALWSHYLLTYLFTFLLQGAESFWESNRVSPSVEIPPILWNPKVHYVIHKCQPPVHILIHIETVHVLTSHFLKIHPNIIVPSTPGFSTLSFFIGFSHLNFVHTFTLPHTCYMLCPPQSSPFDPPNNIRDQYR